MESRLFVTIGKLEYEGLKELYAENFFGESEFKDDLIRLKITRRAPDLVSETSENDENDDKEQEVSRLIFSDFFLVFIFILELLDRRSETRVLITYKAYLLNFSIKFDFLKFRQFYDLVDHYIGPWYTMYFQIFFNVKTTKL